jgi:hypothetical protein
MEEPAIISSSYDPTPGSELEGRWRVERLGGALPPMALPLVGVSKEIRGGRGMTRFGFLPGLSFRVEKREDCVALVYNPPFSMLVDELRVGSEGSWIGRATLGGRGFGQFRMVRIR